MTTLLNIIKSAMFSEAACEILATKEEQMTATDELMDNCGRLSPTAEAEDISKANEKILFYIYSLRDKQRVVTPSQISKDLGYSKEFIEAILIANGFKEDC